MTTEQAIHSDVTKVADYLYEVTCYDYDDTKMMEHAAHLANLVKSSHTPPGGCSAVRVGDYYGRNLDLFYGNYAEFIMHVPAAPGRYASVGVAMIWEGWTPEYIEAGMPEADLALLPFCTMDGINEKGVAINANYIPVHDLEKRTTGTSPGKMDLPMSFIPRYVLDHAATAREAVEMLYSKCNVFSNQFSEPLSELHFMICDPTETYVVEFIENELGYVKDDVMTNFYRGLPDFSLHACGIERYNILKAYKDYVESAEDMSLLMQYVKYSKTYDLKNTPRWLSEIHDDADIEKSAAERAAALDALSEEAKTKTRKPGNPIWQTTHTSVYDLKNRTMRIHVQEDYEHSYEFRV